MEASGEEVDGLLTVSCGAAASSLVRKMPEDAKQETTAEEETGKLCDCCCWQTTVPEPVVLVACGSFNPITTMHLRMMGEFRFPLSIFIYLTQKPLGLS